MGIMNYRDNCSFIDWYQLIKDDRTRIFGKSVSEGAIVVRGMLLLGFTTNYVILH